MITAEEKTRERFLDRSNRDNPDRQIPRNSRHRERKRGPDNTVAMADKSKKFTKPRRYDDIENIFCPCTPMESTSEIATPSTKDTQRKIVRGTIKKTIKKKKMTTMKTRDSKNPEGQWQ